MAKRKGPRSGPRCKDLARAAKRAAKTQTLQETPQQAALRELSEAVEAFDAAAIERITDEYGYDLMGSVVQGFLEDAAEDAVMGPAYADFLEGEFQGTAVEFTVPEALIPPETATTVAVEATPVEVAATTVAEPEPEGFRLPESVINDPRFRSHVRNKDPRNVHPLSEYLISYGAYQDENGGFFIGILNGEFYIKGYTPFDREGGKEIPVDCTDPASGEKFRIEYSRFSFDQLEEMVDKLRIAMNAMNALRNKDTSEEFHLPESVTNDPNFRLLGPADPSQLENYNEYANYTDTNGNIAFTIQRENEFLCVYADAEPYYDSTFEDAHGNIVNLDEALFEFDQIEEMVNACRTAVDEASDESMFAVSR